VLQNFGAKDAIEGVVGKLQPRRITRYRGDQLKREVRPFEIQRGHLVKILCQDLREVAVPSADIQHWAPAPRQQTHEIRSSGFLSITLPILFNVAHALSVATTV
jgi:hypothetical protein